MPLQKGIRIQPIFINGNAATQTLVSDTLTYKAIAWYKEEGQLFTSRKYSFTKY